MSESWNQIGSNQLFHNRRFSVDDTLLYLGLVRGMLDHCRQVVDVGCGRGSYADDSTDMHNLFDLRGPDRHILGIDVDPAATVNPFIDEYRKITVGHAWPTESDSADLVVSDWTLEHVEDPKLFVGEVVRTLHIGGVFIARSINFHSALSLISRSVPNRRHASIVAKAQPTRREIDVFPAFYRMNTPRRLAELLGGRFEYSLASRPALENYLRANHPYVASTVASVERRLPEPMQTVFVLCARLIEK